MRPLRTILDVVVGSGTAPKGGYLRGFAEGQA
jgi:hypothetical protein